MDKSLQFFEKGLANFNKEQFKIAAHYFTRSIKNDPDFVDSYTNLGACLVQMGRLKKAESTFKKALYLDPSNYSLMYNLGLTQYQMGSLTEALENFKKAEKLYSNSQVINEIAVTYSDLGELKEAAYYFKKAAKIDNQNADFPYNLGLVYQRGGESLKAIKAYEDALKIEPAHAKAIVESFSIYRSVADWEKTSKFKNILNSQTELSLTNQEVPAETPFMSISRNQDLQKNFQVAKSWSSDLETKTKGSHPDLNFAYKWINKKIKIGYISNGFRDYPTCHNIIGLLNSHDKKEFEIYAFSHGPNDKTNWRRKVKKAVDHFIEIDSLSNLEAAKKINKLKIDILVDLKGYTRDNRFEILSFRPSPVQVSLLGFAGTTGASFIDYFIADQNTVKENEKQYFSEKVLYMPDIYWPSYAPIRLPNTKYKREDFSLPKNKIVFCSFSQTYKIDKLIFDMWLKILKKVDKSVLWLWVDELETRKNINEYASKKGLKKDRIIFADELEKNKHIKRLELADIALDTLIVNGHTTTTDALWAGIPVVTLPGNHFSSRVSQSMLKANGLRELVADNPSSYVNLAVSLANDPKKLASIKAKILSNNKTQSLFNNKLYTKNLENIFRKICKTN